MRKAQDFEITSENIAVSIVGEGQDYHILSHNELANYFVSVFLVIVESK